MQVLPDHFRRRKCLRLGKQIVDGLGPSVGLSLSQEARKVSLVGTQGNVTRV